MTGHKAHRGGAPVGFVTELDPVEAGAVLYLRLWCTGAKARQQVWSEFATAFGPDRGRSVLGGFEDLCALCVRYGRRPLMHHQVTCKCLGGDEACFANLVALACDGDREDAMLMATLLVRADFASGLVSLAQNFGLALRQMTMRAGALPLPDKSNVLH